MTKSIRSAPGDDAALRSDLRQYADQRMAAAMADGYYIEAIALQDSMISDRLEGLLGLHRERVAMNTIGQLAQLSRGLDPDAFTELADHILQWAERRNVVVHQMVKVGPTHSGSWSERLAQGQRTAEEGRRLLEEVDRAVADYEVAHSSGGQETPP